MRQCDSPETSGASDAGASADVYVFPTSFAQRRLWFLDRLQRDCWTYNVPSAFRIEGGLDVPALEKSLSEIVRRHEILRTTFKAVDDEPSQIVSEPQPVRLPVIDLCALGAEEREAKVRQLIDDEITHVFDLSRGPLLRLGLLKLGDTEHVLIKNVHHIVSDAWSEEIFMREWVALYQAFAQNKPSTLAALPIQYADFSEWQRQTLQGSALDQQLAWWKNQLTGCSALQLPLDHARPFAPDYSGASVNFTLSRTTTSALRELGRRTGSTLYITLLAAFKILLHRYTNQTDIVVGSPITNRNRPEIENLIGFFLNTLVLRSDLADDPDFLQVLERVRGTVLGAFEHQEFPFEMLVEKLHPERNLAQNPLFQAMFVLQRAGGESWSGGGLTITPVKIPDRTAKFDLTIMLYEKEDGIDGSFIYSTALFERATVERMVRHFQTLLDGIAAHPELPISKLPLLSETERKQLLVEWNNTATDFPAAKCVHELFEEQAAKTPGAVAVVFNGSHLTYAELNLLADSLARHLRTLGVTRETLVGICMERSLEMIVGLLAILKAGGAYVPLDPNLPPERMAFLLADASVSVILTQRSVADKLPPANARLVFPDEPLPEVETTGVRNTGPRGTSDGLACVMYTSGSTGTPKGVAVVHRGVVRLVKQTNYVSFSSGETFLQLAPIAFDASTFEIWGPLLNGGKLVVMPPGPPSLEDIGTAIQKHGVTTLWLTAGLFNVMVDQRPEALRPLRQLLTGGEALSVPHVRKALRELKMTRLINGYGPTETTTFACCYAIAPDEPLERSVPIGRPISNTQIYLLDAHQNPVPVGVTGEIHIGGPGLARGYLNAPELSAARFIENPFATGERLYRTGDLGRYLPDGRIEFLGRGDDQVKIRGFRIEPGEIEATLKKHAAVREAAVVAREDTPGEKRLVAYVVHEGQQLIASSELTGFLKTRLPDYMVPSAVVFLEALPLNANGKVDRGSLPAPQGALGEAADTFIAPRDALECELAQIWKEAIGCKTIGLRDNFFDLGGHSLMAVRLFSEIEKRLGKKLPLATLFEAPTIEHLAEALRLEGFSADWSPLVPIQTQGNREPFFCIHGGDGGVLFYSKLASYLPPDQPFYGLQSQGLDGGELQCQSIDAMAALYIREIRGIQPGGPYFLGGYSFGGIVAFEMARQLREQGDEVALVALFDANNPAVPARRFTRRERIALRLRAIAGMNWKRKLGYLWGRAAGKAAVTFLVLKEKWQHTACRLSTKDGAVLPATYRSLRIREANIEAFNRYKPQRYPGVVTLFRAENPNDGYEFDSQLGWGGIAEGGVEIHDVPGEHETMFNDPHVRVLAERMKTCLEKARTSIHV